MSDTELNRFLSDLKSDHGLHEALLALPRGGDGGNGVAADALVSLAQARGYAVEFDDFAPQVGELDESTLNAVVGGAGTARHQGHSQWIVVDSVSIPTGRSTGR